MRGITIVELLIVLGMLSILISIGSIASISMFRELNAGQDRDTLVDALLLARARAQAQPCLPLSCRYGVRIESGSFVVFSEGNTSEDFPLARTGADLSGQIQGFSFANGTGFAIEAEHLTFGTTHQYHVEVNRNGLIETRTSLP